MNKAISENGLTILNYVIDNPGKTAAEIAEALGFEKVASVNGIVTAGLIRNRNLVERVSAGVAINEKGKPVEIKVINPTQDGIDYNHEAALAADAEEAALKAAEKAAAKAEA